MKFRDPKTGEVFEDIKDAYSKFCCGHDCDTGCPLYTFKVCNNWSFNHPAEAARLMGYEVVEDAATGEAPGGKPRICEVLGVEEFERICEAVHNGWWDEKKRQGVTDHPDMIPYDALAEDVKEYDRVTVRRVLDALGIRYESKPRFTEEEVATARALYATGARTIEYPFGSGGDIWTYGGCPGEFFRKRWTFPPEFFPSLRPGQSVALEDIIRAD